VLRIVSTRTTSMSTVTVRFQVSRARPRSARGAGDLERRGPGAVSRQRVATWVTWAAISSLLFVAWLGLGLASGGAAWVPWFLLVVVPWGMVIARRPPDHP